VDDDIDIMTIYREILLMKDHDIVAEAQDGEEAIKIFRQMKKCPDIIIMDHRMPEKNGLDAMKEIHTINPMQGVIFVTADYEAAMTAIQNGASSFIIKPFRMDELFNSIETTLAVLRERQNNLRESLLRFITMLDFRDPKELASICDRIDREVVENIFMGQETPESMNLDGVGEKLCSFFNIMDMDYGYELEDDRLTIRNGKCHWNEVMGSNPAFCFVCKCIISRFSDRTGREFNLETGNTIMDSGEECVFRVTFS